MCKSSVGVRVPILVLTMFSLSVPYIPKLPLAQSTAADERAQNITVPHPLVYEMWLSESHQGVPEAIKSGLFVHYDAVHGNLIECFRMKELALFDGQLLRDPAAAIDFDLLSAATAGFCFVFTRVLAHICSCSLSLRIYMNMCLYHNVRAHFLRSCALISKLHQSNTHKEIRTHEHTFVIVNSMSWDVRARMNFQMDTCMCLI